MLSWPGLLGGIQDQHQPPLPCMRKGGNHKRNISTLHHWAWKNGEEDWIWPHPTSVKKGSKGKVWKRSGQWHEFAALTVRSTLLFWIRDNSPPEGQGLHFNGIIWQRQKPGSITLSYLAFAYLVYIQPSHILPLARWLHCARYIQEILSRRILRICLGFLVFNHLEEFKW